MGYNNGGSGGIQGVYSYARRKELKIIIMWYFGK
jgi:hypothetical protein